MNTITLDAHETVSTLVLNRPDKRNAVNLEMSREIRAALDGLQTAALVVTGSGDTFSAGADLNDVLGVLEQGLDDYDAYREAIETFPAPTVAAIEGPCLAEGLVIALCCDFRVAASDALLGFPEVLRGFVPTGGIGRLTAMIGRARATELLLTGDSIDGTRASEIGLVTSVVEPGNALDAARALASRVGRLPSAATSEIKRLVREGLHADPAEAGRRERTEAAWVASTDDAREGVKAFLERRKPRWEA